MGYVRVSVFRRALLQAGLFGGGILKNFVPGSLLSVAVLEAACKEAENVLLVSIG